jgi:predicted Ser/Thr protein kinase
MDLTDVRRRFAAYATGSPSEAELRGGIVAHTTDTTDTTDVTGPLTDASGATLGTGAADSNWDSPEWLTQSAAPLSCGAVLNDHYELLQELGRGGMGVVYKALDRRAAELNDKHCYVAIKVLNEDFKRHPLAVRSLQRETRKAQKLAHPNILTVFCFDRDGGNAFMVMELLSGHSLDKLVRAEGKDGLPLQRVTPIVKSLGAALSHAHAHGIIHSDFKPSNAFLTDDGVVKVLDFGVARAAPSPAGRGDYTVFDAGQLGAVCPAYATIEMLNGEPPDVRDDVFALAAVTYELLTGRHPFNRIDALKAWEAGLEPQPVRGISRTQWQALKRGLSFQRKSRIATIDEFVAAFVAHRPRGAGRWVAAAAILAVAAAGLFAWNRERWIATQVQGLVTAGRVQYAEHRLAGLNPAAPAYLDEALANRDDLRTLAALAPANPMLARVRSSLADAVSSRVEQYLAEDDIAGAEGLLGDVSGLLPERDLTAVRATVSAAEKAVEQRRTVRQPVPAVGTAREADTAAMRKELSALITEPEVSERWATSVHELMQKLTPLVPADDPGIATAREIAVSTFVFAAVAAHEARQYTTATSLLDTARGFDAQSPQVAREAAAVERDRAAFESGTHDKSQRAMADAQKQKAAAPVIADYVLQAKTQLAAGDVDGALQTLATARKKYGREEQLKDLEVRYVKIADVYDRLGTAVTLNASEQRTVLEELRISEGDDYVATEQMLAATLGDRIADERAADRPVLAASLLRAGREIFPDDVALLERGKAGVLPAARAAEQPDVATGNAGATPTEEAMAAKPASH